jgi:hypothetical protein
MKKSTKAALLSAFGFPGLGHIYLGKYIHGIVLFGISAGCIYTVVSNTVERALQIVEKIQSGLVEPDVAAIVELVAKQPTETGNGPYLQDIVTAIFIVCWIIGSIDSYRIGCGRNKNNTVPKPRGEKNENQSIFDRFK